MNVAIDVERYFLVIFNNIIKTDQDNRLNRLNTFFTQDNISILDCIPGIIDELEPIHAVITNFQYPSIQVDTTPVIAYNGTFINNDSDVAITENVTYSKQLTQSFAFSFKEAVKISSTVKITAGLPIVGEGEVSVTGEISFEATQAFTTTEIRAWSGTTTINIDAGRSAKAKVIIGNAIINSPFTASMHLLPTTWAYLGGHWVPLNVLLTETELKQAAISLSGSFEGVEGVSVTIEVQPL